MTTITLEVWLLAIGSLMIFAAGAVMGFYIGIYKSNDKRFTTDDAADAEEEDNDDDEEEGSTC